MMDTYIVADMISESIERDKELMAEYQRSNTNLEKLGAAYEAHIALLEEERGILKRALEYYAVYHKNPNDGPWGASSDDYGKVALEALKKLGTPR